MSWCSMVCGVRFLHPVFFVGLVEVSSHEDTPSPTELAASPVLSFVFAHLQRFGVHGIIEGKGRGQGGRGRGEGAGGKGGSCIGEWGMRV